MLKLLMNNHIKRVLSIIVVFSMIFCSKSFDNLSKVYANENDLKFSTEMSVDSTTALVETSIQNNIDDEEKSVSISTYSEIEEYLEVDNENLASSYIEEPEEELDLVAINLDAGEDNIETDENVEKDEVEEVEEIEEIEEIEEETFDGKISTPTANVDNKENEEVEEIEKIEEKLFNDIISTPSDVNIDNEEYIIEENIKEENVTDENLTNQNIIEENIKLEEQKEDIYTDATSNVNVEEQKENIDIATLSIISEDIIVENTENISVETLTNNVATVSEIDINILVATESDVSIPYFDNENLGEGFIKTNFSAPVVNINQNGLFGDTVLPARFDMRTATTANGNPVLPAIRNQGSEGLCWAFSIIAMAEIYLRKHGFIDTIADAAESNLSEAQLGYFTLKGTQTATAAGSENIDSPGLEGNDYMYKTVTTKGGNQFEGTALATAYMGFVLENDDTNYDNVDNIFNNGLDDKYAFNENAYEIENVKYISNDPSNISLIKQEVYENGGVAVNYRSQAQDPTNSGSHQFTYGGVENEWFFYSKPGDATHAVTIVGWDDNVPKEYFYYTEGGTEHHPDENGAWLIRNSWGSNKPYMNGGYFWLSYYDDTIDSTLYSMTTIPANTYKYNYHYDTTGGENHTITMDTNDKASNIFKVSDVADQTLDAINLLFISANNNFKVSIYKSNTAMSTPTSGTLALEQNFSYPISGAYTMKLNTKVLLPVNTYFSIVVQPTSGTMILPFDESYSNDKRVYHNESALGQSYFYTSGNWRDIHNISTQITSPNFRIKGLTNEVVKLIFDENGAENTMESQLMEKGVEANINSCTLTKRGYTFGGWRDEQGNSYANNSPITITSTKTLIAQWNPIIYTINYNTGEGATIASNSFTKTYDTPYAENLLEPEKRGWTFNGWYIDDTFTNEYNKSNDDIFVVGTTNYTIYAKWTAKTYTINYNAGEGVTIASNSFTKTYDTPYGENLLEPEKRGWTFNGWYIDESLNNIYDKSNDNIYVEGIDNYNIYAKWTANTYTIHYALEDGATVNPTTFTKTFGTPIDYDLAMPTKTGFTFVNWYKDESYTELYDKTNDDIYIDGTFDNYFIYAKLSENIYNIVYHYDDDTMGVSYTSDYTKPTERRYSESKTLPTASDIKRIEGNTNYQFDGWYTEDGSTSGNWGTKIENIESNTTSDIEVYAKWTPKWKITFDMQGFGTAPDMQEILDGEVVIAPAQKPTEENKKFVHWYTTDEDIAYDFGTPVTNHLTINAKWEDAITVKFNFDLQGHGSAIESKYVAIGEKLQAPENPTEVGYTFVHWYEENEENAFDFTQNTPSTSKTERTLKAKWKANTYIVKYMPKGGEVNPNQITKTYGIDISNLATPTKKGYIFEGWFVDDESFENKYNGDTDLSTLQDDIVNIYAKWSQNTHTITFNAGGGTGSMEPQIVYDGIETEINKNQFTRTRLKFNGWSGSDGKKYTDGQKSVFTFDLTLTATWIADKSSSDTPTGGNGGSGGGSGGGGGGGGGSGISLPQNNQTQVSDKKLSVSMSSIPLNNNTANSTWSCDVNGKWHLNIVNEYGQIVEAKNTFASITSVATNGLGMQVLIQDFYYFDETGTMYTGWLNDNQNITYYFETTGSEIGKLSRGWKFISGNYYYFDNNGVLLKNTITPDGYVVDINGKWLTT